MDTTTMATTPVATTNAETNRTTTTIATIKNQQWEELSENIQYLWCNGNTSIDELDHPPTSMDFLRNYVSKSRPCIIRNVFLDSKKKKSAKKLTLDDIIAMRKVTNQHNDLISVDVTPDGQGDCVRTCRTTNKQTTTTMKDGCDDDDDDDDQQQQQVIIEEEEIFIQPKQYQMSIIEFQKRLRRQVSQANDDHLQGEFATNSKSKDDTDIHGRPILYIPKYVDDKYKETKSLFDEKMNDNVLQPAPPDNSRSAVISLLIEIESEPAPPSAIILVIEPGFSKS